MTDKQKTIALRFVRTLGATVIGFLVAWLSGPDVSGIITDPTMRVILVSLLTPMLVAANKYLRYGGDADDK